MSEELQLRRQKGNLRELKWKTCLIDFASNDYLGLANSAALRERIRKKEESAIKLGSTGSRLLTGNYPLLEQLESQLCDFFRAEACLVFNSGYMANLALLSTIPKQEDNIFYDQMSHACMKEGIRLSKATSNAFRHNDLNDLEQKLKKSCGKRFIVVESIYSMDGDQSPLPDLIELGEKYDSQIFIDEAHSTGILGQNGEGLSVHLGLENQIAGRVYTFGKAIGLHGACIVGSREMIDYLINFSAPFIYTTALPPHQTLCLIEAFHFLKESTQLIQQLNKNISLFKSLMSEVSKSNTAIQPIIIPGNEEVKRISQRLESQGFDVRAVLSPTVRRGSERLRICLHSFNSEQDIRQLCHGIS